MTNLEKLLELADVHDREDGMRAYLRYHDLMRDIATHYGEDFRGVVGAFAALSPNNDYVGNLRSLVTLLVAKAKGQGSIMRELDAMRSVNVSTYRHCRNRAILYLTGTGFLDHAKGLKIRSFYRNIVDPTEWGPVTIDGHMAAAFRDSDGTVKDAKVNRSQYLEIATAIRFLAAQNELIPHQMQATLWYTRKRVKNVKYDPQLDLLSIGDGAQKTMFKVGDIRPFD